MEEKNEEFYVVFRRKRIWKSVNYTSKMEEKNEEFYVLFFDEKEYGSQSTIHRLSQR